MDSGMFKPLQLAAVKALGLDDDWYTQVNVEYMKRRILVWEIMDTLGAEYDKEQTGMFVWAKIPERYESSRDLSDEVLNKAHVFITPGFIFGSNGEKYIRISLCSNKTMLKEALERIKQLSI
jgi:aspartate/methionine/tyrosine aminotransferase